MAIQCTTIIRESKRLLPIKAANEHYENNLACQPPKYSIYWWILLQSKDLVSAHSPRLLGLNYNRWYL